MKHVLVIAAVLGIAALGEPTAQRSMGEGAYAKRSNACYRKCRDHNWSAGRCLRHCRKRTRD